MVVDRAARSGAGARCIVPQLRLAAATLATAAVATMLVVPVGAKPGGDGRLGGPDVLAARCRTRKCPSRSAGPPQLAPGTRTVAVFGDSMAWTMMRYLPPTPGFRVHRLHHHRMRHRARRSLPVRPARRSTRSPNATTWPGRWAQRINHDQARRRAADRRPLGDRRPGQRRALDAHRRPGVRRSISRGELRPGAGHPRVDRRAGGGDDHRRTTGAANSRTGQPVPGG